MNGRNRLLELGSMTTQVAIKELEHLALGLFLSKEHKAARDEATQEQIAEIIFSKLSGLKGTGLKLLQALSLDEGLLPAPYIKRFEDAYGKATPLSRPVVKKVIKTELGEAPEHVFAQFDYDCLAAASLGQVHAAKRHTGEAVVVKIQYPNVAENIEADLKFIRSLAGLFGNPLIRNTVTELADNLLHEVDYVNERSNVDFFNSLPATEGLALPRSYAQLTTKRVLTLSKVDGVPLHLVQDRAELNLALQRVFRFFFSNLKAARAIHSDPHPGNVLIGSQHTAIVDFGSVKRDLPPLVVELFLLLLQPGANPSRLVDCYAAAGADVAVGSSAFYQTYVQEFHQLCTSLFNQQRVDFKAQREVVSAMRKTLFQHSRERALQGLTSEFTLLHKATQSLLFMFCKYGCEIDTHID